MRHPWVIFLGVMAFLIVLGFFWFSLPRPRINIQSYEKIKQGMTEKEVMEILGCREGNYTGQKASSMVYNRTMSPIPPPTKPVHHEKEWWGETAIVIQFDSDNKVVMAWVEPLIIQG